MSEGPRLARMGIACALAAGAALILGAARTNRTVEAERFVLRDARGKVRSTLEATPQGCELSLRDAAGKRQVRLRSKWIGPDLTLFDDLTGRESARLDVAKGEPSLSLYDEKQPRRSLTLLIAGDRNGLILRDAEGRERLLLVQEPRGLEAIVDGKPFTPRR